MKDRTGSSNQAIKASIIANHPTIKFAQHLLRSALKRGVETGKLVQVKSSYKLVPKVIKAKPVKKVPAVKGTEKPKLAVKAAKKAAVAKVTAPKKVTILAFHDTRFPD